jgi:hypothetical protein
MKSDVKSHSLAKSVHYLSKFIYFTEGRGYFYDCKQMKVFLEKKEVILYYRNIHLESFEMWCWRRTDKISWTDHVRNEEVFLRVKEQANIVNEIIKRKANWIDHILIRNCLLQQVIEGKIKGGIEVTGRRGRRRRKLLDDRNERRGYSHLKEVALDRTTRRARFERGVGPVVRQTAE